jgi:hypothetical protein
MATRLRDVVTRLRHSDESVLGEIEQLTEANRANPDAETERRLVRLRNEAFRKLSRRRPDSSPEGLGEVADRYATYEIVNGIPEVAVADLSAETIRSAFLEAGCLLVRGLMPASEIAGLTEGIDTAMEQRDANAEGTPAEQTTPWFEAFEPAPGYSTEGADWNRIKAGSGAVWACDSPRMMFRLLEAFERAGILQVATDYLGERPCFSMNKAVLRRTPADAIGAWHQDGAFLGQGIRTLNVWLALSECGERAPALDMVPRRFEQTVETGTEGAAFPWSVSNTLVEEMLGGEAPPRPVFKPGDAMLFDHLCLHRTGSGPGMDQTRYATETWCFASSAFPDELVPLVV